MLTSFSKRIKDIQTVSAKQTQIEQEHYCFIVDSQVHYNYPAQLEPIRDIPRLCLSIDAYCFSVYNRKFKETLFSFHINSNVAFFLHFHLNYVPKMIKSYLFLQQQLLTKVVCEAMNLLGAGVYLLST